jgi:hypothetical protein
MNIPIQDMKDFASDFGSDFNLGDDIGNVINLNDIGSDDLGMGLLANSNFGSKPSGGGSGSSNTINVTPSPAINNIELQPLEPLGGMDDFNIPLGGSSAPNVTFTKEDSMFGNAQSASSSGASGFEQVSRMNPEEERRQKADLITKLDRLEKRGYPVSKRFTTDNTLDEIKEEFNRLTDARSLETSIKFQRQMLMGLVTGIEMLNDKVVPDRMKANIDGWSESVNENLEDYDEIFEELYDKYKGKGNMPPEARLIFALAGSGFMYHVSNSFMRKNMPSMDDLFKQNPGLRQQIAQAAANSAGQGFGNFMGMAMPGGGQQPQMPPQTYQQQQQMNMPTGAFFQAPGQPQMMPSVQMPQQYAAAEPPRVARKEMNGPSGVDDILRTFEDVRAAEMADLQPPSPQSQPMRSQIFTQPAISALNEIHSVGSDDFASRADSTMTGRTRGTAARRKAAAPVGNVLNLNV